MSRTGQPDANSRSPWSEAFAPEVWIVAPRRPRASQAPEPEETDSADEAWTTEAIFDCYND